MRLNEFLTAKEVYTELGLSRSQWDKQRKNILEYLKLFYEFEVIGESTRTSYIFYEELAPYEPYSTSKGKKTKEQYQKENYAPQIIAAVKAYPYRTYTSIQEEYKDKFDVPHADKTQRQYIAETTKELFGTKDCPQGTVGIINSRAWCRKDYETGRWIPLTEEQVADFMSMFTTCQQSTAEEAAELISMYRNKEITRKDLADSVVEIAETEYIRATDAFREKYGWIIRKVPEYMINSFSEMEPFEF